MTAVSGITTEIKATVRQWRGVHNHHTILSLDFYFFFKTETFSYKDQDDVLSVFSWVSETFSLPFKVKWMQLCDLDILPSVLLACKKIIFEGSNLTIHNKLAMAENLQKQNCGGFLESGPK